MAHKKGVGSSRNGRDSNPKYRGVKKYGGERVETLHFRLSRVAAIGVARDLARAAYYLPRRIKRKRHLERVDRAERAY